MAEGPWTKYQAAPADDPAPAAGPWEKYAAPSKPQGSKGEQAGRKAPGWMKAGNALLQGATFGFSDEVQGAVGAASAALMKLLPDALAARLPAEDQALRNASLGDAYRMVRDAGRGMDQQFAADHPIGNVALQAAGGLALPMGPLGKALPAGTNPLVGAAAAGAVAGAVGGAGGAGSLSELPGAVARGAMVGGVAGPAIGAVAGGGGAVINNIRSRLSDDAAADMARRRVAEALARDARTTQQVQARLGKLGERAVIADAAGQNTRNLLDTVATTPGQTADAAEALILRRQAGRSGALTGAARAQLSPSGARLPDTLADLDSVRRSAAAPLYARLRGVTVDMDDDLAALLDRAAPAMGDVKRLAQVRGEAFDIPAGPVPLQQLDTLKRSLYDLEQANINPETGRLNELGNAYKDLRRALVAKLDDATRDAGGRSLYADARAAYAGPTEMRAAANLGSQAMSKDAWRIEELTAGMSPSEIQAFKVGAFEALRKKLGTEGGQTQILKMWKEPATREKLQAMFGSERSFREFASAAAAEARLKRLEGVGRGSQTARREAAMDDLNAATAGEVADLATSIKTGNPFGVLERVRSIYGRVSTPEPVRDNIGRILLTQQSMAAPELQSLEQIAAEVAARRGALATASGVSGAAGMRGLLGGF